MSSSQATDAAAAPRSRRAERVARRRVEWLDVEDGEPALGSGVMHVVVDILAQAEHGRGQPRTGSPRSLTRGAPDRHGGDIGHLRRAVDRSALDLKLSERHGGGCLPLDPTIRRAAQDDHRRL